MAMPIVRDMSDEDEYYVGTCTHVYESGEIDDCARRRLEWLHGMSREGLRVKVAVVDHQQAGFLYIMPVEVCPWGPLGRDLMTVPCLVAHSRFKGRGVGKALLDAAEEETVKASRKGLVVTAFYHEFWFMPAAFFVKNGFTPAACKEAKEFSGIKEALLWKVFDGTAEPPEFLRPDYRYAGTAGKVTVDLFWNTFCETSDLEARRVREVAGEYGDRVVLNEYCADDRDILLRYQIPRAIFVNGREISWGYEAPREGIREAIAQALAESQESV